jgi:heme/copper-type cytochrome/quinol oxidase subunit 1
MLQKLKQPYWLSLFIGILLCAVFAISPDRTLDINIHDTYVVIYFPHIGFVALIIYLIYAGIYFLMRNYRNYVLSLIHLFSGVPLFVILFLQGTSFSTNAPKRYYPSTDVSFIDIDTLLSWYRAILILFFAGQLVFFANIIIATAKAVNKKMEKGK